MRSFGEGLLLSASDLMKFIGCRHATALDLACLRGAELKPREDTEDTQLLQKHGDLHEKAHLDRLKAQGRSVVEIPRGKLEENVAATREVLAKGPDVVFQGALLSGHWGGWSDFLERVDRPSRLGNFSYEVTDTKLKRKPHPKHVLQLVLYSDLLAEVQGVDPEFAHVELGNGDRATLRLKDYEYYARAARERLEAFIEHPEPTRPVPCSDCSLCRWADHCTDVWNAEDSLFNIANISRGQVKKLEAAGVTTLEALASHDGHVRGIAPATESRLKIQARLQQARKAGEPHFELRTYEAGKGFDLLPQPQKGDLFYDIEGDPHYEGKLEYLHGVWFDGQFKTFWAHDHAAEAQSLKDLLEFFRDHLAQYPGARIYHYAPYEITALRRLTQKYGIDEAFLDRLMRERRFVDLYAVVRSGVIASEANYSIKSMEVFYGLNRDGEVKTAGGSVIAYEKWRETQDQSILDEIEDYNRVDCQSTEMLRDWLVKIRPNMPWPQLGEDGREKEKTDDADITALRDQLAAAGLPEDREKLLFNLGIFHKREAKPAWWAVFDSLGQDEDKLIEDLDALAGLEAVGPAESIKQSKARTYRFPPQETKMRSGRSASVRTAEGFASVTVETFNRKERLITLKIGNGKAHILEDRLTIHPQAPLDTKVIAAAIRDVIDDQCGRKTYRALDDLLSRNPPRMKDGRTDMVAGQDTTEGTIDAVAQMEETVLPIQGPPGTGKTYVTARAIVNLVKEGKRVGVASNSHEAIRNVLIECLKAGQDANPKLVADIIHKVSGDDDGYPDDCPIRRTTKNEEAASGHQIVGGTAFFFARDENVQAYDWLFVDEAGQVGLANMVAMGRSARNIMLVGDPQQLPQVIQGAHPEPLDRSCLEWMIDKHPTIPPDRGIFLDITRRMHPAVCEFISDQVYESRLKSAPDTANQSITNTIYPDAGAFWVPIEHEGNVQTSQEEVEAIRAACDNLMKGTWTDKKGHPRPIHATDIIVVAPYNAQVNALREALPNDIRVGTVDKFQGQEAPICLISMTTSSAEETSRGFEFLFSLNRINVAISRAKALALVFGSPKLREAKCETIEQMKLVNVMCAIPTICKDKIQSN